MHLRSTPSPRRSARNHRYITKYAGDKIGKIVTAAGVKIEPYWPKLFAKALQGQDISSFFNYGGSASSAPAAS